MQFYIEALDNDASDNETEVIINRFPIDLELELGTNFTERTTYTGIYNISGLEFDMSFRVQCSENYYGPNCTTFCEPIEGVIFVTVKGDLSALVKIEMWAQTAPYVYLVMIPQPTAFNVSSVEM